jgi:hypothetical protein
VLLWNSAADEDDSAWTEQEDEIIGFRQAVEIE